MFWREVLQYWMLSSARVVLLRRRLESIARQIRISELHEVSCATLTSHSSQGCEVEAE